MAIYLVQVFLIGFVGLAIHPKRSNRKKRNYLFLVFLLLTIVSGIRAYSVGSDTITYVYLFENIDYVSILNVRYEPGFIIYLRLLHKLSSDPAIMLFTSSIICVGTASYFTYRLSKDAIMSMMLYVLLGSYFFQLTGMRQALSISIAEIAFLIILTKPAGIKQKIVSGLLILLAVSIHTVAIVNYIPYILMIKDKSQNEFTGLTVWKVLRRSFGIAIVGFAAYSLVIAITVRLFPAYAEYFSGTWSDSNYNASLFNTLIAVVFAGAGALVFGNRKLNNTQKFAAIMIGFSVIFYVLSMRMEIWNRLSGFFGIYTSLLWTPEFTSEIRYVHNRWLVNSFIIMFGLAYMVIVLIFRPEWSLVVPYMIRK